MNSVNAHPAKRFRVNAIGTFLVTLLSAGIAWSQATPAPTNPTLGDFMPKDGDMSLWVLSAIFGNWQGNAAVPMLGAAMQQLNIFALAFGTLMFTWVSIIGTLNSAQDGEVLGKKWSTTWVPLRFVAGTALMVPLATGYSTAQHLILWLAMAGSGGASAVWGVAMDGFAGNQAVMQMQSPLFQKQVEGLFKDVLKAEVCMATMGEASGQRYSITRDEKGPPKRPNEPFGVDLKYGVVDITSQNDVCGTIRGLTVTGADGLGGKSFSLRSPTGFFGTSSSVPGFGSENTEASKAAMQAYASAQINLILQSSQDRSENGIRGVAQLIAARSGDDNSPVYSDAQIKEMTSRAIKVATARYVQGMSGPTQALLGAAKTRMDAFIEGSRDAGWMMAGPAFFQMANIRTSSGKMVNSTPEIRLGDGLLTADLGTRDAAKDLESLYMRIENNLDESLNESPFGDGGLTTWIASLVSLDADDNSHALVQMKNRGDYMMGIGQTIGALAMAGDYVGSMASGAGKIAELAAKGNGLVKFLSTLAGYGAALLYFIAGTLFFAGITMSLILPTLPFLMSIGAVTGWLMAVFSAVVAAPIWLAGHLNPDGDGFAGQRAAGGYMILLETATRPIFIVLGLIGAFLIMDPVCRFASFAFMATINAVQANSTTGPASVAVLVCLFVVIIWTVVRTTLTLTYDLAQKVYTWVGGQFAGYEKAAEFAQGAQTANQGAARGLTETKMAIVGVGQANKRAREAVAQKGKSSE